MRFHAGQQLGKYPILREIGKALERPTREEFLAQLRARPVRQVRSRAADVVRAERDSR